MKRAALSIVIGLAAPLASAQPYAISWSTVDGGGTMSAAGGAFALAGTIGQPDAGGPFAGSPFVLHGGFWALAAGGVAPESDLAVAKTNGQASSVPGQLVTWTITVSNAGPAAVTGATITDAPPTSVSGLAWTCTASPGSFCPPSGSGPINATVNLLNGGSATFQLGGLVDPAATGLLANTASVSPPPGVIDPVASNNAATDTDQLTPQADLAFAISDTPDPVAPGAPLVYTLQASNLGPSRSPGMTLTSVPDATLVDFVSSTPGAPTCTYATGTLTCNLGALDPGEAATVTLNVRVKPVALAPIVNDGMVTGTATDPVSANNTGQATTAVQAPPPFTELLHGTRLERPLPAVVGVAGDQFRVRQSPYSSYEVVVDGASGDLGVGDGPGLELLDEPGAVLQVSQAVGSGPARSLRFANATSATVDVRVRVRTLNPAHLGGPEDTYRLRAWDTTLLVPRFNNSGSQVTVVLLQNPTAEPVTATLYFWSPNGALLATHTAATLLPKGLLVLNTAGIPALAGASGSMTVVHDGPYGALAGKTVALEPTTGFSFDSPMLPKPR
jgi:uncharacterized repeat protein (TIGR01451 family)